VVIVVYIPTKGMPRRCGRRFTVKLTEAEALVACIVADGVKNWTYIARSLGWFLPDGTPNRGAALQRYIRAIAKADRQSQRKPESLPQRAAAA
jgi:hypothetical protein